MLYKFLMPDERIYLNSSFDEKDEVRACGARWDQENRGWWISRKVNRNKLRKWLPRMYKPECKSPHITSEMVPQNMWYINLRSLLPKQKWDQLRTDCYRQAGHRCQVCGGKGSAWPVECNEQWQYIHDKNEKKGTQKLIRLTALCPLCHKIKHLGRAQIDGEYDQVLEQMAFVNSWSKNQCEEHAYEAFDLWEKRSEMEWQLDLSILKDYEIDHVNININIMGYGKVPNIQGVSVQFKGYAEYFNRNAHIFALRPEFLEAGISILKQRDWRLFPNGVPFWYLNFTGKDDQVYQAIDCTNDLDIHDSDISRLATIISKNERQDITTVLFVQHSDVGNDDAIYDATSAQHPNYIRVAFPEGDFFNISCSNIHAIHGSDVGDDIRQLFVYLQNERPIFKQRTCGLEFLKESCLFCNKEVYNFSGIVLPDRDVSDWQSNSWLHVEHIYPMYLSDKMIELIAPELLNYPDINTIKTMILRSEDVECPHCKKKAPLGYFRMGQRTEALSRKESYMEGIVYKPINIKIDYETMKNIDGCIEVTCYSA